MVNFPTRIPDVTLAVLLFWIYLFLLALETFPPLGNSDHVVVLISIKFPSNSPWNAPFYRIAYDYSPAE